VNGNENLLQRTFQRVLGQWRDITSGASVDDSVLSPDLTDRDADRVRSQMRACLEGHGGEVSARARAATLGSAYMSLTATGRARFLRILATEFGTNRQAIAAAATGLDELDDPDEHKRRERRLRAALEPPRLRLLTQFNALPDGVKFLVDMRATLLDLAAEDETYGDLEADLKSLLVNWFDVGFLELRQITWNTPAAIVEKLIEYEAVHEISDWREMKSRLGADRRCYAYFHPRMPDEPLIFVEVALTAGIADKVQTLLAPGDYPPTSGTADTAIFYSISNCQRGLDGIGFGGFLIKRVVAQLAAEMKRLESFATLSPIPGFRRWLQAHLHSSPGELLTRGERRVLDEFGKAGDGAALLAVLIGRDGWHQDAALAKALAAPLTRLCAHYLTCEKRNQGRALDPVAHFHLSNGARMERINWLADTSPKGIAQSAGLMVNYLYETDKIPRNHEAYTGAGEVPASSRFRALLR
jgi:malonyl-CoA decarboxylase